MDGSPLALIVCAAPLAERADEVAAALLGAGWDVSVIATPAAASWVDSTGVAAVPGRQGAVEYRRPGEPRRGSRAAAVVACPLTFNTMNKLASGASDTY